MDVDVGQALSRDISSILKVETELDNFIERQHAKRVKAEGERAEEMAWKESSRKHAAARDAQLRAEWTAWHRAQAHRHRAVLAALIEHHEEQAERYQLPHARLHDATS